MGKKGKIMHPIMIKGHIYTSTLEALEVMSHKYVSDELRHDIRDYFEAFLELCLILEIESMPTDTPSIIFNEEFYDEVMDYE